MLRPFKALFKSSRFKDLDRSKKIHRAIGMSDMPLFCGGAIHAHRKPLVAGRESQLPHILSADKAGRVPRFCITKCDSVHAGPLKVMGILLIGPILKVMGTLLLLVAQTPSGGSLTESVSPAVCDVIVPPLQMRELNKLAPRFKTGF